MNVFRAEYKYKVDASWQAHEGMRSYPTKRGDWWIDKDSSSAEDALRKVAQARKTLAEQGAQFRLDTPSRFQARLNGKTYDCGLVTGRMY